MDKKGKQQLIIRICCVIAAFILWLFIASTETPLSAFKLKNVPVKILNTEKLAQSNLILVPGQDLTTSLSIKGTNTSMLLNTKAEEFTVVADLSEYALKKGEQKIPIQIGKSPDNISVVNSDGLFITINLDERMEAKLPIAVDISGKPKDGFYASAAKLSQIYGTVVGGSKLVSTVKKILVEIDVQGLEEDVAKSYKLIPVDASSKEVKDVVVNPSSVDIEIPIRKTKSLDIIAKTIGKLNPEFELGSIKVIPERFDVTGSATDINKVETLSTEVIDLSKINKTTTMEVKVLIPAGLSLDSASAAGTATVKISIKKIVQKNLSLDIKYNNLDEKYDAKLAKIKTAIVISGTEEAINALDLEKITATIDLASLVEGEHTVKVVITIPEGAKLVSQDIAENLVTITKKQTEVTTTNGN